MEGDVIEGHPTHPATTTQSASPPPSVLVLGGQHRNALGIVRNLGHQGIPVYVGADRRFARSNCSRYAARHFTYPPVDRGIDAAHQAVLATVRAWRPDVLLPTMDETWRLVYAFYAEYAQYTRVVPCPGRDVFEQMLNKKTMTERAQRCGVATPRTMCPASREAALAVRHELPYPVLLKPAVSVAGQGIRKVDRAADLAGALSHFESPPLIQELIRGEDLELTLLCLHGTPLAGSTYLSLRNAPLPFGPPIACRTIRDDALLEAGIRLLKNLRFHGVAHLDFRRDRRDGIPKLLDFNARLAGTNEISVLSGVNFPLLLYRIALGEAPAPCFDGETDLEFRWLIFGELRHLLRTDRTWQVARQLLTRRNVSTNLWLTDPLPHLAHLLGLVRRH